MRAARSTGARVGGIGVAHRVVVIGVVPVPPERSDELLDLVAHGEVAADDLGVDVAQHSILGQAIEKERSAPEERLEIATVAGGNERPELGEELPFAARPLQEGSRGRHQSLPVAKQLLRRMQGRRERRRLRLHGHVGHPVLALDAFADVAGDLGAVGRAVEDDVHRDRVEAVGDRPRVQVVHVGDARRGANRALRDPRAPPPTEHSPSGRSPFRSPGERRRAE